MNSESLENAPMPRIDESHAFSERTKAQLTQIFLKKFNRHCHDDMECPAASSIWRSQSKSEVVKPARLLSNVRTQSGNAAALRSSEKGFVSCARYSRRAMTVVPISEMAEMQRRLVGQSLTGDSIST